MEILLVSSQMRNAEIIIECNFQPHLLEGTLRTLVVWGKRLVGMRGVTHPERKQAPDSSKRVKW